MMSQKSKEESSTLQARLQDQVYRMKDYIFRLESEIAGTRRQAAAIPVPGRSSRSDSPAYLPLYARRCVSRALWCVGIL